MKDSITIFLVIAAIYIGGVGIYQIDMSNKETVDWTGTTQGVQDSLYWQQEEDSINRMVGGVNRWIGCK